MDRKSRNCALLLFAIVLSARCANAHASELMTQLRRPISLSLSADEKWLYVANRDSGSVSTLELEQRKVVAEEDVAERLSHMIPLRNEWYLATDEASH